MSIDLVNNLPDWLVSQTTSRPIDSVTLFCCVIDDHLSWELDNFTTFEDVLRVAAEDLCKVSISYPGSVQINSHRVVGLIFAPAAAFLPTLQLFHKNVAERLKSDRAASCGYCDLTYTKYLDGDGFSSRIASVLCQQIGRSVAMAIRHEKKYSPLYRVDPATFWANGQAWD
jgi:hypothetical protein